MNRQRAYLALTIACLVISAFLLIYPFYVIRPFRYQGPRELMLALAVMRVRPVLLGLCVAASIYALIRRERRILGGLVCALVIVCAGLSRINIYEQMFHPMGLPSFESTRETKLNTDEMVIAIHQGGAARAYPIRIISYHHIVNDVVGGVPIVATY
jgi:hypothetical protein